MGIPACRGVLRLVISRPRFGCQSGVFFHVRAAPVGASCPRHDSEVYYMPAQSKLDLPEKVSASLDNPRPVRYRPSWSLRKGDSGAAATPTAAGAHMKVYKNNTSRLLLSIAGMPEIDDVAGTCAYVFYENDPALRSI